LIISLLYINIMCQNITHGNNYDDEIGQNNELSIRNN